MHFSKKAINKTLTCFYRFTGHSSNNTATSYRKVRNLSIMASEQANRKQIIPYTDFIFFLRSAICNHIFECNSHHINVRLGMERQYCYIISLFMLVVAWMMHPVCLIALDYSGSVWLYVKPDCHVFRLY